MTPMLNKYSSTRGICAKLLLLACTLFLSVSAQADPAGRIGRIAWLSGTVNLYNPDTGESFPVPLNQPLTSGDVLTAEANSRTEIQIGSMAIRLDAGSQLELTRIDDEQVELSLKNGRVLAKLPSRDAINDFSLETPDGRFTVKDTGVYRFDSDETSSTATVYYGTAHFVSDELVQDVFAGQSRQFWYDNQMRARQISLVNDAFTQWSADRDRRPPSTTYTRYVSSEMTGAEDLDAYGNWSSDPELGAIWFPRNVDRDWAPYRTGHWAWVAPWGWNWVGAEPWGFAPFHYGRWVQHRGAWGWVPGTRVVRPVYSPAMVAWVGTPSVGVSIRIGASPSVGWFPLAPREVFVPSYRSSANYVRNVNITHVTNIANVTNIIEHPQDVVGHAHYANRDLPRAMTIVPSDVVAQRRPVAAAMLPPGDHRALRDQPVQVIAPVAAPRIDPQAEERGRRENADRAFPRRDNPQQDRQPGAAAPARGFADPARSRDGNVASPAAAPSAPVVTPQRSDRPLPDGQRPDIRRQPEPVPAPVVQGNRETAPQATAPAAPVITPQREDRPMQDGQRPGFQRRPDAAPAPTVQVNRNAAPQTIAPAPQAPATPRPREIAPPQPAPAQAPQAVAPQRVERPMPEVQQRPAPQPRVEAPQMPQAQHENSRPAEARPQRQEERQHQAPSDEELKKRKKEGEQRP